jgi:hypothetical protein
MIVADDAAFLLHEWGVAEQVFSAVDHECRRYAGFSR